MKITYLEHQLLRQLNQSQSLKYCKRFRRKGIEAVSLFHGVKLISAQIAMAISLPDTAVLKTAISRSILYTVNQSINQSIFRVA